MEKEWLKCPVCNSKTRIMIREDTILKNFILFCPKCKNENLINLNQRNLTILKEPDTLMQSR